jgi:hypothetical protein
MFSARDSVTPTYWRGKKLSWSVSMSMSLSMSLTLSVTVKSASFRHVHGSAPSARY